MKKVLLVVLILVVVAAGVLYFFRGRKVNINVSRPTLTDFRGYDNAELSTLTIPISIDLQDVEDKINDKLDDKPILIDVPIKEDGRLQLEMSFYDDVEFTWDSPKLRAIVPINFIANGETKKLGITFRNSEPVVASVLASVSMSPELSGEWEINSNTSIDSYKFVDEPTLKIGPLDISLTNIIDKQIKANKEKIESALSTRLNKKLKVRKTIEKLWNDIQKPMRINRKGLPLWLTLKGTGIKAQWQKSQSENPTVLVEIQGYYDIMAAETRDYDSTFMELPAYAALGYDSSGIDAHVLARIPYNEIRDYLNPRLDTLRLSYANYDLRLDDLEIFGGDSLLFFQIRVKGDVRGTVNLKGRPVFNDANKSISVSSFDYALETGDEVANTADGWLHDFLIEEADNHLYFELDSLLQELPVAISRGIERSRVGHKIDIVMNEFDVSAEEIRGTTDHLMVVMRVKGKGGMQLDKRIMDKKKPVQAGLPSQPGMPDLPENKNILSEAVTPAARRRHTT